MAVKKSILYFGTFVWISIMIFVGRLHKIIPTPLKMSVNESVIIGIGIPKAGTNKLDTFIPETYGLTSCNHAWSRLKPGSARDAIYCSSGKTLRHPAVRRDVLLRLGRACRYLGTHHDMSVARVFAGLNASYVTMLREPVARLVSACNYSLGKHCNWDSLVELARSGRGYGMKDRMTAMLAGIDPVCSLEPAHVVRKFRANSTALLHRAKINLTHKFVFVGILERLPESLSLLPSTASLDIVLPRQASKNGSFQGDRRQLLQKLGPYIQLDLQLYKYANQLLDQRLKKS